jgi:Protein of unknown function (DUF3987)
MTATRKRWGGHCLGCNRDREVESRSTHAERVLCDECAAKPHKPPTASIADLAAEVTAEPAKLAKTNGHAPPPSVARSWPAPMDAAARHGFVGDVLATIEPHTEADPHALLVQLLVAFGNVIGRGAGFQAEADFHATNLFALIVGETAKGRKGTSLGYVRAVIATADSDYVGNRIEGGLSSGEGLVYAVRDATTRLVRPKKDGAEHGPDEWVDELTDPGVEDKRLLVLEGEFAQALKVMARPGNTLSPAMRNLWDHGKAGSLTKNDRTKCTDAHVSIIGHIVRDELRREMTATEMANGFANRFLFVCAKRSKMLPEGGSVDDGALDILAFRFAQLVSEATRIGKGGPMVRDAEARQLWHEVYPRLSEGRPGMLGAVTARSEAIVMRVATIYAVLDGRTCIGLKHLRAALAVWRYCEDSARYVFGDAVGDPVADELLEALRSRPEGMSRTEIRDLFGRHRSGAAIEAALAILAGMGAATSRTQQTSGRPVERWYACDISDQSDQRGSESAPAAPSVAYVASVADERCPRCEGLVGYDDHAQATRCVNGHRQEPRA